MTKILLIASAFVMGLSILCSCSNTDNSNATADKEMKKAQKGTPEYFNLRPKLEKDYS
ncbi:MAG: hypothetical protein ACHQF0_04225 [Chitinophagales bacterium]